MQTGWLETLCMAHGKFLITLGCVSVFLAALGVRPLRAADPPDNTDEELLKRCNVGTDGAGLLAFLHKRTLTDAARHDLEARVRELGSPSYRIRERATWELIATGSPALAFLRRALDVPDAEVVRRAQQCIAEIDKGPGSALPTAAIRLLVYRHPAGSVTALLAYAPFADDDAVEDEILTALGTLAVHQGKVDPEIVAAAKDVQPARRGTAAYLLGRWGSQAERATARALLKDAEVKVRLRAAKGLVAGRQKDAVPVLVELLGTAPIAVAWEAEELLCRIAGEQAPKDSLGSGTAETRHQCQVAWTAWWRGQGPKVDLAKLDDGEHLLGLTIVAEPFSSRVWECGPDGKRLWEVANLQSPWDAQSLPGGRVLIAEYQGQRVTERDLKGHVLWEKRITSGTPNCCQRLPNGNTFITTNQTILEVDRKGNEVYSHNPGENLYIVGAMKQRDGRVVCGTSQGVAVFQHNGAGKDWKMTRIGNVQSWCRVEGLANGRFLVAVPSEDKVLEMDATGKVLTNWAVPGAASAVRLPNGHTLVACSRNNRVWELDRNGKMIWEKVADGQPWRVRRR
jgi:hypothetical protein